MQDVILIITFINFQKFTKIESNYLNIFFE